MREHDKDAVNEMDKFVHYGPYIEMITLIIGDSLNW